MTVSELSISIGGKYMIFFPLLSLFLPLCLYFSPCVFIFSLLGHAINCSTFAGGVLGENILCLCFPPGHAVWYLFTFLPRQLLGYELEEKQYNIFPPGPVFFLLVTCCIWFPFSDSYGTEVHENDDIYPWLKCTFFCL